MKFIHLKRRDFIFAPESLASPCWDCQRDAGILSAKSEDAGVTPAFPVNLLKLSFHPFFIYHTLLANDSGVIGGCD